MKMMMINSYSFFILKHANTCRPSRVDFKVCAVLWPYQP